MTTGAGKNTAFVLILDETGAVETLRPFTWLRPWSSSWCGSLRLWDLFRWSFPEVSPDRIQLRLRVPENWQAYREALELPEERTSSDIPVVIRDVRIPPCVREETRWTYIWEWMYHLPALLQWMMDHILPQWVDQGKLQVWEGISGSSRDVYVGKNVRIRTPFLNTEAGPIVLEDGVEVMEGAMIRGPVWIGPSSQIRMGTALYGPVLTGPVCKLGGEVSHVWIHGFTNKSHEGFLGHAIVGMWCNLGAETSNSNLKNNYAPVKVWDYSRNQFVSTGLQFCGLFLADHSRTGIHTMLNTGTVAGPFANIFGGGFPRTFIPPFAWGGREGWTTFQVEKALEMAERMMARRNQTLTPAMREWFRQVFIWTRPYRWWEAHAKTDSS